MKNRQHIRDADGMDAYWRSRDLVVVSTIGKKAPEAFDGLSCSPSDIIHTTFRHFETN